MTPGVNQQEESLLGPNPRGKWISRPRKCTKPASMSILPIGMMNCSWKGKNILLHLLCTCKLASAPRRVRLCPEWGSLPELIQNHWFWSDGWNPAQKISLLFLLCCAYYKLWQCFLCFTMWELPRKAVKLNLDIVSGQKQSPRHQLRFPDLSSLLLAWGFQNQFPSTKTNEPDVHYVICGLFTIFL